MATYRTTIILKTDIVDSTPRLAGHTQAEMSLQRKQHKQFIAQIATKNHGAIFQEEGDAYWIEFPSVTNACLAAIEMHQELHAQQAGKGEKQRLAIRAVITAGDILHEGTDSMGMTMSLTARLEKITPADETYLAYAAWLLLNKAEVQTSFVKEFQLKGFTEPERVFRVDQKHKVRTLSAQFIVFIDLRGWSTFTNSRPLEDVEEILIRYDDLLNEICDAHGGVVRNASGDQYFLTFSEADPMFGAIETLCRAWNELRERHGLGLSIAIHKGDLNIIRSYLFGNDIHATQFLERLNPMAFPDPRTVSVVVTEVVKQSAAATERAHRFQQIELGQISSGRSRENAERFGAYWFSLDETPR